MGILDHLQGIGASSGQQTEDKLLMAKLFRHLRNEHLEEKIEGLDLKVRDSGVTVYGLVDSSGAADRVVETLSRFQGVSSVNNQLSVRPQASNPSPSPSNPGPKTPDPQQGDAAEAPPVAGRTPAEDATAPGAKPVETSNSNPKASNIAPVTKKVGAAPVFHMVGEGTTLWAVAEKYLGDGNRYMEIFEANRPMLKDPNVLSVGQKLKIPQRKG